MKIDFCRRDQTKTFHFKLAEQREEEENQFLIARCQYKITN
jgi:hypothetical protein